MAMTMHQKLVSLLTQLDAREQKKDYNIYRIGHYLRAAQNFSAAVSKGQSPEAAFADIFAPARSMHTIARKLGLHLDVQRDRWIILPTAVNPRSGQSMRVQSLLFDRGVFTPGQARSWAHAHGFKYGEMEIPAAGKYIHLRQLPPRGRIKRIIPIGSTLSGIRAIVLRNPLCCP